MLQYYRDRRKVLNIHSERWHGQVWEKSAHRNTRVHTRRTLYRHKNILHTCIYTLICVNAGAQLCDITYVHAAYFHCICLSQKNDCMWMWEGKRQVQRTERPETERKMEQTEGWNMRNEVKQGWIKYLESEAIKSEGGEQRKRLSEMKRKTNRQRKRAD